MADLRCRRCGLRFRYQATGLGHGHIDRLSAYHDRCLWLAEHPEARDEGRTFDCPHLHEAVRDRRAGLGP